MKLVNDNDFPSGVKTYLFEFLMRFLCFRTSLLNFWIVPLEHIGHVKRLIRTIRTGRNEVPNDCSIFLMKINLHH